MGRKAEVHLRTFIYTIETDMPRSRAKDVASKFDDYNFAFYLEDKQGRLSWIYQPSGSARGIKRDIESLKRNKKPAVEEVFDVVDIKDEETGEIYASLNDVDLFGILKGIQDVYYSWEEKRLREGTNYDFYNIENGIVNLTYMGAFRLNKEEALDLHRQLEEKRREYMDFFDWLSSKGKEPFKLRFHGRKTLDEIISILDAKIRKNTEETDPDIQTR